MKRHAASAASRAMVSGAVVFAVAIPLFAWAQGSAPAGHDSAMRMPAVTAKPAVPEMKAPAMPTLSDSARAAIKAQIGRELKAMADTLKLTPDQRARARTILLDQGYQLHNLREKYMAMPRTPENRAAMTKEMQALRDSTDARLVNVLSADQMARYKKWREERLTTARSKMGTGAPKAPPDTTAGGKK